MAILDVDSLGGNMGLHETPGPVVLDVSVPFGSLKIETTETSETKVEVVPRNETARSMMDEVQESARLRSDGSTEVRVHVPGNPKRWGLFSMGPKFEVTIQAPNGAGLRAETVSADVRTSGSLGDSQVRSVSGDLELDRASESELKTVSGDVSLSEASGDARVETVSGSARIDKVEGRLTFKSVSGDLRSGSVGSGLRATLISGDLQAGSVGGGEVDVKTTSGDVEIGVAPGASVWMDVSSLSGDTTCDLDMTDDGGEGVSLEIRASSMSGDIRIRRGVAV